MDTGIISAFKRRDRKRQLQHAVNMIEDGKSHYKIEIDGHAYVLECWMLEKHGFIGVWPTVGEIVLFSHLSMQCPLNGGTGPFEAELTTLNTWQEVNL